MVMKKIYGKKREIVGKSATHVMQEDEKLQFFHDVAERAGCGASDIRRFVKFANLWWGKKPFDPYYVSEWADRFAGKREYMMADFDRQELLIAVDGSDARQRYYNQLVSYGGWTPRGAKAFVEREIPLETPKKRYTTVRHTKARRTGTKKTKQTKKIY
jgi:hypothetical protein